MLTTTVELRLRTSWVLLKKKILNDSWKRLENLAFVLGNAWAYPRVGCATWVLKSCAAFGFTRTRVKTCPSPKPLMSTHSGPFGTRCSQESGRGRHSRQKRSSGQFFSSTAYSKFQSWPKLEFKLEKLIVLNF